MLKEIFGKKIGMTQVFGANGDLVPVTLLDVEPVRILETVEYPKKKVARVGCFKWEAQKLNKLSKPSAGYFKKLGVAPYRLVREILLDPAAASTAKPVTEAPVAAAPAEGESAAPAPTAEAAINEVGVEIFKEGEIVDVRAKTKGRGFAGGIKRHGWHGGPMTHGSMSHRRIGSNGANTDPGRVVKGHRMPGHYGNAWRTVKNVTVVKVDKERNLLYICGAVPGSKGTIVNVKKI